MARRDDQSTNPTAGATATGGKGGQAGGGESLTDWHDGWIAKILGEGDNAPSVVALFGYLAASPDADQLRIYLDPHLSQCIEVPAKEVVHREAVPAAVSPLGGSYVWINSSAWNSCKVLQRQC